MMATVPHVTSGLGLTKFQTDGFLLTRVYINTAPACSTCQFLIVTTGCYDSHLFTLRQHRFTNHAKATIMHDQETHT